MLVMITNRAIKSFN